MKLVNITASICAFLIFILYISPLADNGLHVSAENEEKYVKISDSITAYISSDENSKDFRKIVLDSLNEQTALQSIDTISIGFPVREPFYRENTGTVDLKERTYFISGVYFNNKIIGYLYFDWHYERGKIKPICEGFIALAGDYIPTEAEKAVIFQSSEKSISEVSAGGVGDLYIMTDNGSIKPISTEYRPKDDYFEKRNFSELDFSEFPRSVQIPVKLSKGIADININYSSHRYFLITDGKGNYLTRFDYGYRLEKKSDELSQSFEFIPDGDETFSIVNTASKRKLEIKSSNSFVISYAQCSDYNYDGYIKSIVTESGYALSYDENNVYGSAYKDKYLPEVCRSWYLEAVDFD